MSVPFTRDVLLLSLAINYGILLVWFLVFVFGHEWLRQLHGKWFRLSNEQFDVLHYGGMAVYKIGVLLFLDELQRFLGCEFAVEKTLYIPRPSLQRSTIEEHLLRSILDDAGQHVEEGPLSLMKRELPTGLDHDASRLVTNLLNDGAHDCARILHSTMRIELASRSIKRPFFWVARNDTIQ
ncbi:MAG TPA: hypothetical protein VJL88_13390 [Nitrospira sp.]|nr:hypothetical protein [Nitrospira sp.]